MSQHHFDEVCKQVSDQKAVQAKLHDAQERMWSGSAWKRSVLKHAKANDRHLAQVDQQRTVTQTRLVHEKFP